MKNYEKEIDIIEMIRSFREIRIVLREFMMRERQNFAIDKTSELGFLNSIAGQDDESMISPTSVLRVERGNKLSEPLTSMLSSRKNEETLKIKLQKTNVTYHNEARRKASFDGTPSKNALTPLRPVPPKLAHIRGAETPAAIDVGQLDSSPSSASVFHRASDNIGVDSLEIVEEEKEFSAWELNKSRLLKARGMSNMFLSPTLLQVKRARDSQR